MWRVNNTLLNKLGQRRNKRWDQNLYKTKENGNYIMLKCQFQKKRNISLKWPQMSVSFLKFLFIILQLSQFFLPPLLLAAHPTTLQSNPHCCSCPWVTQTCSLNNPFPSSTTFPTPRLLWKLSDCSLFPWLWFCFACYFILFITFLLEERSCQNFRSAGKVVIESLYPYRIIRNEKPCVNNLI